MRKIKTIALVAPSGNIKNLEEILDSQRQFFSKKENWNQLKDDIASHLLSMTTKTFILNRNDTIDLEISSKNLSDGSMMIAYKIVSRN